MPMFGLSARSCWFVLLICTLVSELVPLSLTFEARFPSIVFHVYGAAKLLCFFLFGFITPLAWWRYNTLGAGALFAVTTTAFVEISQGFIPGHRTSIFELAVKLILLFTGFAAALEARKFQQLTIGSLSIRFSSRYWANPS